MARKGRANPTPRPRQPLPPPLPPERRTVGQLVAETISFYRHHFFQVLPLGLSFAAVTQLTAVFGKRHAEPYGHPPPKGFHEPSSLLGGGIELVVVLGALLLTVSYIAGIVLVTGVRPDGRTVLLGYCVGVLVYLPVPVLAQLLVLPAVLYLAAFGWTVPAILVDRTGFRDAFRRSLTLARVDYVHAAGGLATLVILFIVVRLMLLFLLRTGGEATERGAVALADLVLSPVLFVGSAIVYLDLAARVRVKAVSSGHAQVPDADDADGKRSADVPGQPRPHPGGQS
jgi:hypothetical protein